MFIKSMYHRMACVERDLQDQLVPTLCRGQGHLTVQASEMSLFYFPPLFLERAKNAANARVLLVGRITGNMTSVYWDFIKCQALSHQKAASCESSLNAAGRAVPSP